MLLLSPYEAEQRLCVEAFSYQCETYDVECIFVGEIMYSSELN